MQPYSATVDFDGLIFQCKTVASVGRATSQHNHIIVRLSMLKDKFSMTQVETVTDDAKIQCSALAAKRNINTRRTT